MATAWQRPLRHHQCSAVRLFAPWPSIPATSSYPRADAPRPTPPRQAYPSALTPALTRPYSAATATAAQEATAAPRSAANDELEASTSSSSPPSPSSIQLRPYQERAVSECLSAIASGITRIGVSSPTGSGKTTMFVELIARLPPINHPPPSSGGPSRQGTRVLIVVNSIELALQAASAVTRSHPSLHVEIEQGAKYTASGFADVTVATYQTLMRSEGRLEKFDPRGLKAVIVDEAHHAASKSYVALLSRFDPEVGRSRVDKEQEDGHPTVATAPPSTSSSSPPPRVPILGFSATFSRHDGLSLGAIFSRIVFHRDFLDMIDDKWLCPVRFTSIRSDLDLNQVNVSSSSGDYERKSLSRFANVPGINRLIVRTWLEKAWEGGRKSTLVFCIDVQHTIDLTTTFREYGIDARYLHGGTPLMERKQLLSNFKANLFPVLVNCAILTEGFDLPQIDTVVLARPTRSRNLFSQMIGRGLRLSPQTGKVDCLVLDLVGNIERGVVCTPTLFGLDPSEGIDGLSIEELKMRAEEAAQARGEDDGEGGDGDVDPEKVTFIDYSSPRELQRALTGRKGHDHIARLSPNAWVNCGGDLYVLEIPRKGFIRIEKCEGSGDGDEERGEKAAEDGSSSSGGDTKSTARWSATFTRRNADMDEALAEIPNRRSFSPYRRPMVIFGGSKDEGEGAAAPSLEAAVRACDTYATTRVLHGGPQSPLLRRDAPWRSQPASASQRALVAKRMGWGKEEDGLVGDVGEEDARAEEALRTLTKGKAGEMLTRLKFGFRKRWEAEVKARNRVVKAREKEERRREKERVRVGDLAA